MDKKARAERAKSLMADEVLQEAFNGVLSYHTSVFTKRGATDAEVLEARRMVFALNEVTAQLGKFIGDGKIIEKRDQDRGYD